MLVCKRDRQAEAGKIQKARMHTCSSKIFSSTVPRTISRVTVTG